MPLKDRNGKDRQVAENFFWMQWSAVLACDLIHVCPPAIGLSLPFQGPFQFVHLNALVAEKKVVN